jgi:small subunit ribosomal protein S16
LVKIRLMRIGANNRAFFRVVAMDERRARNGRALEFLGTYDPTPAREAVDLRTDAIERWVEKGAQLTDAVRALLRRARRSPAAEPAAPAAEAGKAS